MNIHPILVHFPIALMTIYAVAEIVSIKKFKDTVYWFYVKATLVITGTLFAFLSLGTGDSAEELVKHDVRPLVNMHANFAATSTWIFGFLAVVYLVSWISKSKYNEKLVASKFSKIWNIKVKIADKILNSYFPIILAIVGLITITITGALGGAIVYGPDVDPIVNFIYHLFF